MTRISRRARHALLSAALLHVRKQPLTNSAIAAEMPDSTHGGRARPTSFASAKTAVSACVSYGLLAVVSEGQGRTPRTLRITEAGQAALSALAPAISKGSNA